MDTNKGKRTHRLTFDRIHTNLKDPLHDLYLDIDREIDIEKIVMY